MGEPLVIDDRVTIPDKDLSWAASRSGGPGGQNVNKVSSRVELRFDLAGTTVLDAGTRARLLSIAKGYLDADGRILLKSDTTRDQRRNLEDARDKLKSMILLAMIKPKRRRPTRPSRGAVARRLEGKHHQSAKKEQRRGGDQT